MSGPFEHLQDEAIKTMSDHRHDAKRAISRHIYNAIGVQEPSGLPVKSMCPSFQAVPLALDTWLSCNISTVSSSHSNLYLSKVDAGLLPPNEVGKVDNPGQAGCLRPQELHNSISYCAWHKSMETTRPKRVVNETETSNNGVEVAACRTMS